MVTTTQYILLTDEAIQSEVLEAQTPVLVDCWASWCGSPQLINPTLKALASAFAGQIKVGRLDVATSKQFAAQHDIRAVPTLLLFHNGQVMERIVGSVSWQAFANKLNALLIDSPLNRSDISCL